MRILTLAATAVVLHAIAAAAVADDIDTVKSRVVTLYSGTADPARGPLSKEAVAKLERHARGLLENPKLWPDLSDAKARDFERDVARHYDNILILAQAFTSARSQLKALPELKVRIEAELRRGLKVTQPGTPRPGNWYHWIIGTPRVLGPTLLLLEGKIDAALWDDSIKAMADLAKEPALSGANAVWEGRNHLYLGLLQRNPARIARAAEFLQREISIGGGGSGLLEDYSFQFHGRLLHTSGYGAGYAYSAAEAAWLCDGTAWALPEPQRDLLANHLLEHARWVVMGDRYDLSVRGRGVLKGEGGVPHLDAMLLLAALPSRHKSALQQAAATMLASGVKTLPVTTAALGDALPPAPGSPLTGFRHFYATDFAVLRRPTFYTSVRMYSNRVIDYEGNWDQNLSGWFLCYGLTYFSRSGDELWRDETIAGKDFDWDRLPGTTVRAGVHPPKAYNTSTSPFAGGAGGDDPNSGGMCGFILEPAAGDFTAQKSYFFFDKGFAALGSGISSTAPRAEHVITTITQWPADKPNLPLVLSGNRTVNDIDGDQSFGDVRYARYDKVAYLFPDPVTLHARRRGKLLSLWLDHGPDPKDAGYAYIVLPDARDIEGALKTTLQVLERSATAHIVHAADGATGAIFWRAGTEAKITTDAPAILYHEPGRSLTVSNPLHTSAALHVSIDGSIPQLTVNTIAGRSYRTALGNNPVRQQAHEDYTVAAGFSVTPVPDGDSLILSLKLPDAFIGKPHTVVIRGPQGHLRGEFAGKDALPSNEKDVVRYRWKPSAATPKRESTFHVTLFSGLFQMSSNFELPRQNAPIAP